MNKNIILAGVGGQGILSIATVIGYIAIKEGLYLKQSEVHGMSQRGGDVSSHLRLSNDEIAADLIPKGKADMIISVEPMESLRYIPWLSKNGWIITNSNPYINIPNYPDITDVLDTIKIQPRNIILDADRIAREIGSEKCANMVILGAAAPFLGFSAEKFYDALQFIFGNKGNEIVRMNVEAFNNGLQTGLVSKKSDH